MGKRDEAHDTVATASRDRKGVQMGLYEMYVLAVRADTALMMRRVAKVMNRDAKSNIYTTRRRIWIWKPRRRGGHPFDLGGFHKHIFIWIYMQKHIKYMLR